MDTYLDSAVLFVMLLSVPAGFIQGRYLERFLRWRKAEREPDELMRGALLGGNRAIAERDKAAWDLGEFLVDAMALNPSVFVTADRLAEALRPASAEVMLASVENRTSLHPRHHGLRLEWEDGRRKRKVWRRPEPSQEERAVLEAFEAAFSAWRSSK